MFNDYELIQLKIKCEHCNSENEFTDNDFVFDNILVDYKTIEFTCKHCNKTNIVKLDDMIRR